jgi:hypothetical protein
MNFAATSSLKTRFLALALLGACTGQARAQSTALTLDDFESGVGKWTRNDKVKSDSPSSSVLLVDVLATQPSGGGAAGSTGAGLFTFKAAQNSWASASLRVRGAEWAKIGARSLRFWLNADGQTPGVELMLRATARNADGSTRDVVYELPVDPATKKPKTIKLTTKSWRQVAIPLSDFRDKSGNGVARNLGGLYLLQFVQRGSWNSRFFSIDDMRVLGTGVPIPIAAAAPRPTPRPVAAPVAVPENAIPVEIDFLKEQGRLRASANTSIGALLPSAEGRARDELAPFRASLGILKPRYVRLDAGALVELLDSSRPAFDFSRLASAARNARLVGAEPVIALSLPSSWGLDARGYAAYASQTWRALNAGSRQPVRAFELSVGGLSAAGAVAYYNGAHTALRALSRSARVGGVGTSNAATVSALLKSARGLDFLSIPFYGAASGAPDDDTLFNAALSVPALKAAAAALDRSRFRLAPLWVTQANMSGARGDDGLTPLDLRLSTNAAGAWWGSFLINGSRLADQIFHNDAANPEWGLLNERASAYHAYYALWMWNTFFPPGSVRVATKFTGAPGGVQVLGVNTPTAHNALFVNTSDQAETLRLTIRGFPVLRQARARVLQDPLDPATGVRFIELPKSPFQTIELPPYAVAVLQFIEPPRKAAPAPRPRRR